MTGTCSRSVIFAIIAVLYYVWTWSPILAELGGDNAIYFLTANLFSPYSTPLSISAHFAANNQYPPLYPFILGILGGGNNILIAHLITTTILLIAMLVMYKWIICEGPGRLHSLVLIIVFAMIPGVYIQALSVHSENLYILFTVSVLCVIAFKDNKEKWIWVAAILVACCSMTRSAGISMILAFIIYLFINKENNKLLLSAVAFIPAIAWSFKNNNSGPSYMTLLSDHYSSDFLSLIINQIITNSVYMLDVWCSTFTQGMSGRLILSIFAVICILSLFYRLYMRKLDGIYAFLYISMIISWPYPAESMRLLIPVIPILLVQTSICMEDLASRWNSSYSSSFGSAIILASLLLILIPNLILTINRFNLTVDDYLVPYKRTYAWYNPSLSRAIQGVKINRAIVSSLEKAKSYIPAGQCIYSIKPSIISLYTDRISHEPPATYINDSDFYKLIEQSNCRFFYFLLSTSPSYNIAYYPFDRIKKHIEVKEIFYLEYFDQQYIVAMLGELKK